MSQALRIVSLISSATEILYGLGLADRVVAVSHECDYPREVAAKPRVTSSLIDAATASGAIDRQVCLLSEEQQALYEINVERMAALAPDLIVTQAQCDVCAVRYEDVVRAVRGDRRLHAARVIALSPNSLQDVLDDIARLAEATGTFAAGQKLIAQLQARVTRVRDRTEQLPPADRTRVCSIEWIEPLMLSGNWMPELINIAGGQCSVPRGSHSAYHAWEDVVRYDPQVIVVSPCGFDLARTLVESPTLFDLPAWNDLSAVRAGRAWAVDGNAYFNRCGPRLVDSLEILAHLFHPRWFDSLPASTEKMVSKL